MGKMCYFKVNFRNADTKITGATISENMSVILLPINTSLLHILKRINIIFSTIFLL